jgi:hypothetical protein
VTVAARRPAPVALIPLPRRRRPLTGDNRTDYQMHALVLGISLAPKEDRERLWDAIWSIFTAYDRGTGLGLLHEAKRRLGDYLTFVETSPA